MSVCVCVFVCMLCVYIYLYVCGASQVELEVNNLPVSGGDIELQVQSLGQEDPLQKGIATHSSIHAQRSVTGYSPWGPSESDTTEAT